jgi:hypothetical protein
MAVQIFLLTQSDYIWIDFISLCGACNARSNPHLESSVTNNYYECIEQDIKLQM